MGLRGALTILYATKSFLNKEPVSAGDAENSGAKKQVIHEHAELDAIFLKKLKSQKSRNDDKAANYPGQKNSISSRSFDVHLFRPNAQAQPRAASAASGTSAGADGWGNAP